MWTGGVYSHENVLTSPQDVLQGTRLLRAEVQRGRGDGCVHSEHDRKARRSHVARPVNAGKFFGSKLGSALASSWR